jgi:hypothetical protein
MRLLIHVSLHRTVILLDSKMSYPLPYRQVKQVKSAICNSILLIETSRLYDFTPCSSRLFRPCKVRGKVQGDEIIEQQP